MFQQPGFLGTNANLLTDLTLLIELFLFFALCVGVVAQRKGKYKAHDLIQTPVVIINFFLIVFVMISSFMKQRVVSTLIQRPSDIYYLSVAIHAALGIVAEILAIYAMMAGYKILPRKIGKLKYWMWATFAFWTAAVIMGVFTYYIWYIQPPAPIDIPPLPTPTTPVGDATDQTGALAAPPPQQVALLNFEFAPTDMTVVAGTELTWFNQDNAPHNVTFVDGQAATDDFFAGESFTFNFDEPGTYPIYCTLHGNDDGTGMYSVVTVLPASAENVEEAIEIAQLPPTPAPAPPTPTPAPVVPPAPADLVVPTQPEQIVLGLVSFFDQFTPSDSVNVLLSNIAPPPAGFEYQAWLTNSANGELLDLGKVDLDANGNMFLLYNDEAGRNLFGTFDNFQITQEPEFDDDPTPGAVVYAGIQPTSVYPIMQTMLAESDAPLAYGLGARRQTEELLRHVEFVQIAYELLSIADAKRHAEHVVNLLEGSNGEFFGDLDGAHGTQNPGDGFGILAYVTGMQAAAIESSGIENAGNAVVVHATHVMLATDNALNWGTTARDAARNILAADSIADISEDVATLTRFSNLLLNGEDTNGDGNLTPTEGGIFTAYQHAQYMGAIVVISEP